MGTSIENVITLQLGCELQSKPIGAKFSPLLCGTVNGASLMVLFICFNLVSPFVMVATSKIAKINEKQNSVAERFIHTNWYYELHFVCGCMCCMCERANWTNSWRTKLI